MRLDEYLVEAARELLKRRFPGDEGIAAAMYTDDGTVLTSVFFEPEWDSVALSGLDTSPKSVILGATSSGKQVLRVMNGRIHRSAWRDCPKSPDGGELVPCQAKKTAPRGLLWALHATRDPVSKALLRLFGQSQKRNSRKLAKAPKR
jgi:hypothetical protein